MKNKAKAQILRPTMYVSRRASKVDLRGGASIYIYIYIYIFVHIVSWVNFKVVCSLRKKGGLHIFLPTPFRVRSMV